MAGGSGTVAVVGRETDPHATAVARAVQEAGADVTVVDTTLPSFGRWRWHDGRLLDHRDEPVEIGAAYVRSVHVPVPLHPRSEVRGDEMAEWLAGAERRRRRHLWARTFHAGLEATGVSVANPVAATWLHRSKPAADLRLQAAGVPAPRGLVSDDPVAVREFATTVDELVRKPVAGGGACVAVGPDDLTDHALAGLATAPMLFQERVRGDDLRVYVLDGEVVAGAHIVTDALDYRGHEERVDGLEVDDELADLCLRAARALGMVFTGIDVKRAPDGGLVVLDVNPSPMFLGIEQRTGQPIAAHLADHLVAAAALRSSCPSRSLPPSGAPAGNPAAGGTSVSWGNASSAGDPVLSPEAGSRAPRRSGRSRGEALVVVEGADPGAEQLGRAFRRHGWRLTVLDLRYERPTLAAGDGETAREPRRGASALSGGPAGGEREPAVLLDGRVVPADVVLNRTGVTGLGLAPASALDRQLPTTWSGRHLAAREEQGLLLACFDVWDRQSRLFNPVTTTDRHLLRKAVNLGLGRAGVPVEQPGRRQDAGTSVDDEPLSGSSRKGTCWVVGDEVVGAFARDASGWREVAVSAGTAQLARHVAAAAGLRLGQISFRQYRDGSTVVTRWHPVPRFRHIWEHTGADVASLVVAALVGADAPAPAPSFLATDLEPNLLTPRSGAGPGK